MGFGAIDPEAEATEPIFHARWEERMLGLTLCAGAVGGWNIDQSRHAREDRHPADYYSSSYYEIWLKGLERLLVERGLVGRDELDQGRSLRPVPADGPTAPPGRMLTADRVPGVLSRGGPTERDVGTEPRFAVGDMVTARTMHPAAHTRLPRYVRGRRGVVEAVRGAHVYPDTNARGEGEQPQWLYTVRFDGAELWGPEAEAGLTVSVDAWEPYLEPVSEPVSEPESAAIPVVPS